jgi:hypothetical protein
MLSSTRAPALAALVLASAACAARSGPPAEPPPSDAPVATAPARPVVPPGHLLRAEVDQILVSQGPPWLLRRILSEEVMRADGKFAGWRLVGLPEEWRDVDLKPGDIVSRVNGLPLETPDQFWEAWKSVAGAAEVKISLMRDGAARQVVLPIDGPPSPETSRALAGDSGPRSRAPAPAERRGQPLGGNQGGQPGDEEAY